MDINDKVFATPFDTRGCFYDNRARVDTLFSNDYRGKWIILRAVFLSWFFFEPPTTTNDSHEEKKQSSACPADKIFIEYIVLVAEIVCLFCRG